MTDAAGVICRRCGFSNQGGDQFCGSCGAFLEWEGEAADGAAPTTPAVPAVADEGLAGLVHPAGAPASPPAPAPATAASRMPAAPVAPPSAAMPGLLRCPACGIANAGGRTFCQSCGTRPAHTPGGTAGAKDQTAAAGAAPPRPRPVPVPGPTAARTEPSGGGSRGIAGWVIGIAVLGIVVGVGIVAASVLLKSPGPDTGASAVPTIATSAVPGSSDRASSGPVTTDAPVPSEAPVTAAPTAPIEAAQLQLAGAAASSVVGGLARFQADRAIDGDYRTCWQEGAGTEKGQWIEVSFAPSRVDAVVINNGYGASAALYTGNHRLKVVRISVDGGVAVKVTLKDTVKAQRIELGEIAGATKLRITIVSVYPAVKTSVTGTPFDDAALGEIGVIGVPGG